MHLCQCLFVYEYKVQTPVQVCCAALVWPVCACATHGCSRALRKVTSFYENLIPATGPLPLKSLTGEPPNNGHVGTRHFVLYREVEDDSGPLLSLNIEDNVFGEEGTSLHALKGAANAEAWGNIRSNMLKAATESEAMPCGELCFILF